MKHWILSLGLSALLTIPGLALQFDLNANRVAIGTQLSDLSASLAFAIDGAPDAIRPATGISGPDGSPLTYHFVFDYGGPPVNYDSLQDCDVGPCSSVTYSLLTVSVCGISATRNYPDLEYPPAYASPIRLPNSFGPDSQPFPGCPLDPACALSVAALDFGAVASPDSVVRTFAITNIGEEGSILAGQVDSDDPVFTIVAGADYDLPAGASQVVTVQMSGASVGEFNANILPGGLCPPLPATGRVALPGICLLSTDSIFIHPWYEPHLQQFIGMEDVTIRNVGEAGSLLTGTMSGSCNSWGVWPDSFSLEAGESLIVTVGYNGDHPASQCWLNTGSHCSAIYCQSAPPAQACVTNPTELDFGVSVGDQVWRSFTLYANQQFAAGLITTDNDDFHPLAQSFDLDPDQSMLVDVVFVPSRDGPQTATIHLGDCATVSCSGTGDLSPQCFLSTNQLDFGAGLPNSPRTRDFTIYNNGVEVLQGSVSEDSPRLSILSGADYALALGQSQVVTVQSSSPEAGVWADTLRLDLPCQDLATVGTTLAVTPLSGPASACGGVDDWSGFLADWNGGLVGVAITPPPAAGVTVSILVNNEIQFVGPAMAQWHAADHLNLTPWQGQDILLRFQVSDGLGTWNADGSLCQWDFSNTDLADFGLPELFALAEPAPNPFNPSTRLRLDLPARDEIRLEVVDLLGRRVDTIFSGWLAAGSHDFTWQPRAIASGSYFVVAEGRQVRQVRRVLVIR